MTLFRRLRGRWRMLWGLCPACNSDAPELYACRVCGFGRYPKSVWWSRYLKGCGQL